MILHARSAVLLLVLTMVSTARAANVSWQGQNPPNWTFILNWSPISVPAAGDDVFIGDLALAQSDLTTVNQDFDIASLTLSGSTETDTGGNLLDVDGDVTVGDFAKLIVLEHDLGPSTTALAADNVTIQNSGQFVLRGGQVDVSVFGPGGAAIGVVNVNAGGDLAGYGTLRLRDNLNGDDATLLVNDGTILAGRAGGPATGGPYVLRIETDDLSADLDLDGTSGDGAIVIDSHSVLDLAIGAESFFGTLDMKNNSELRIASGISFFSTAVLNVDAGLGAPGTPLEARIIGGSFFPSGSTVNVNSGTLVVDTIFNPTTFSEINVDAGAGITFRHSSTINGDLNLTGAGIVLNIDAHVTINDAIFDWDGGEDAVMNISRGNSLTVNASNISPSAVDDAFDGTINLVGGSLVANITGGWEMAGTINLTEDLSPTSSVPEVSGSGVLRVVNGGLLNAVGGDSQVSGNIVFEAGGATFADVGTRLAFTGGVTFAGGSSHTGKGTLAFENSSTTVTGATTLNMIGDVLLDADPDTNGTSLVLNSNLVVNAATVGTFGTAAPGSGTDLIQINSTSATLTINQSAASSWTLGPDGQLSIIGGQTIAPALAGDDLTVQGRVIAVDNSSLNNRIDVATGGVVTVNVANTELRLNGGSLANPSTLSGGTINGSGELGANAGRALEGHGTIDADVRFQGNAELVASGGTLNVNGEILDAGIVRVESGATLDLGATLNTGNLTALQVEGVVQGSGIVNNGVTSGGGSIRTSSFLNNGTLRATDPAHTLLINLTGPVDLDGSGISGQIEAIDGRISVVNPLTDAFGGDITIGAGRSVNFSQAWILGTNGTANLNGPANINGLLSTAAILGGGTQIDGRLNATGLAALSSPNGIGDTATINVPSFSDRLFVFDASFSVEAGATFAGDGLMTLDTNVTMALEDNAVVEIAVENRGQLELGNLNDGVGKATVKSFDQTSQGTLLIDLAGTGVQQFDQLVFQNQSTIDGLLDVELVGGFVPTLGAAFPILTGVGGVIGEFDTTAGDLPALAGLAWEIDYTGAGVVLRVIDGGVPGDYNEDGVVDAADYTVWRGLLGQAVALPNETATPGQVTPEDYDVWKSNFGNTSGSRVSASTAVPEPTGGLLITVACLAFSMRRRRHTS